MSQSSFSIKSFRRPPSVVTPISSEHKEDSTSSSSSTVKPTVLKQKDFCIVRNEGSQKGNTNSEDYY